MKKKELPIDKVKELYLDQNKSLRYIADIYEVAPDTIKSRLIENGVLMRDSAAWKRGKKESKEQTEHRTKSLIGKKHTDERRLNQSIARKKFYKNGGKNWCDGHTKETHDSLRTVGQRKENHWAWKGGITELNNEIRNSSKYKKWRKNCFIRDNFECVRCGSQDRIVVHHIIRFHKIMENINNFDDAMNNKLLFDEKNGETLCFECHNNEHNEERKNYLREYNFSKHKET